MILFNKQNPGGIIQLKITPFLTKPFSQTILTSSASHHLQLLFKIITHSCHMNLTPFDASSYDLTCLTRTLTTYAQVV